MIIRPRIMIAIVTVILSLCFVFFDLGARTVIKMPQSIEQHVDRSVVVVIGEVIESTSFIDTDNTARIIVKKVLKGAEWIEKDKELIVGFPGLGISEAEKEIRGSYNYIAGDKGLFYLRKTKNDKYYWTERFVKDSGDKAVQVLIREETERIEKHLLKAPK